jgi:endonuclease YncB( thermonuclease family)
MTAAPKAFIRTLAACALLLAACAVQADFSGKVIRIIDGDTVDILVDREPMRIRLAQIDAPEKRQAFGTKSRHALAAMVSQKTATVITAGTDRYGRTIGTVLVDGRDINRAMVGQGMAWVYRQHLNDFSLIAVETKARENRVGLWADAEPVAPWVWRASARNESNAR